MSAQLLLGKPCVESIKQQIAKDALSSAKLYTVGFDNPAWQQYATSLSKSASAYNLQSQNVVVSNDVTPNQFVEEVQKICRLPDCGGIILQQPLPKQFAHAVNYVDVNKDVDCLNPLSVANMYLGKEGYRPATAQAVINLLDFYNIPLQGANMVIVGRGNAVGKPLALLALSRNATVTVCHTKTQNLAKVCRNADILVSACGVPDLITTDFVTPNTVVIDVGLSFVDGKTHGDVSKDVYEVCKAVSPVPGGVGPVTRATLFLNLLKAITK